MTETLKLGKSVLLKTAEAYITGMNRPEAIAELNVYFELNAKTPEQRKDFLQQLKYEVESLLKATSYANRRKFNLNNFDAICADLYSQILTALLVEEAPDETASDIVKEQGEKARRVT